MVLGIVQKTISIALDTTTFAGVGYLSGRLIHQFEKWSSIPSIFTKKGQADFTSAMIYCGAFAAIDHIAHNILSSCKDSQEIDKPFYSALRIAISASAAVSAVNFLVTHVKLESIEKLTTKEMKPAIAIILTAIIIYNFIVIQLNMFNQRYVFKHQPNTDRTTNKPNTDRTTNKRRTTTYNN